MCVCVCVCVCVCAIARSTHPLYMSQRSSVKAGLQTIMLCIEICHERMDSMKSWAGIEERKAGRSVCCVMQSVRVLVMCCGIVLHTSAFMLELRRELGDRFERFQVLRSHLMS